MKKARSLLAVVSLLTICLAFAASAEVCPYDSDYGYVLKKTLVDYYSNPQASRMQPAEIKGMLDFYLTKQSITGSECSENTVNGENINSLIAKADASIPDAVLSNIGNTLTDKCFVCPDGAVCGEENDKGQTCTCKDVDKDGQSEFCYLKPIVPPKPTCQVCPDGTLCGEKNAKGQTCECTDANDDGLKEYCMLEPITPPETTTTTTIPPSPTGCDNCRGTPCGQAIQINDKEYICDCMPWYSNGSFRCDLTTPCEKCDDGTPCGQLNSKNHLCSCLDVLYSQGRHTSCQLGICPICPDGKPCNCGYSSPDRVCIDRYGPNWKCVYVGGTSCCEKSTPTTTTTTIPQGRCITCPDGKPCDCRSIGVDTECTKRMGPGWNCTYVGVDQCCAPSGTPGYSCIPCSSNQNCIDKKGPGWTCIKPSRSAYGSCCYPPNMPTTTTSTTTTTTTTIPPRCITCPDGKPCDCNFKDTECTNRMGTGWKCGYIGGGVVCCITSNCSAGGMSECKENADCVTKYGAGWTCKNPSTYTYALPRACCYPPNMPATTTTTTTSTTTTTLPKSYCITCPDGKPCDCDYRPNTECTNRMGPGWNCTYVGEVNCCAPQGSPGYMCIGCSSNQNCIDKKGPGWTCIKPWSGAYGSCCYPPNMPTTTTTSATTTTTLPKECSGGCASRGWGGPYKTCKECVDALNCPSICSKDFYGTCSQGYTCAYDGGYYCSCCCKRNPGTTTTTTTPATTTTTNPDAQPCTQLQALSASYCSQNGICPAGQRCRNDCQDARYCCCVPSQTTTTTIPPNRACSAGCITVGSTGPYPTPDQCANALDCQGKCNDGYGGMCNPSYGYYSISEGYYCGCCCKPRTNPTTTTTTTPDSQPCNQMQALSYSYCSQNGICPAGQRCRNDCSNARYCCCVPGTTTTTTLSNCIGHGGWDCKKTSCCAGLECKEDLLGTSAWSPGTCCNPNECAIDTSCSFNGRVVNGKTCKDGQWI